MFALTLLYIALTIVRPQDYLPGLVGVPLLSSVIVLAMASWLLSSVKTFAAPHFWLLPLFLVAMMVSQVVNGWMGGAIEQIGIFGPSVALFFVLATALAAKPQRLRTVFALLVGCATVLAVHGIDQKLNGVGWTGVGMVEDGRIRYVGIFKDPNDLGMLFVSVLPMAAYLSAGGVLRRLLWGSSVLLLLYGIYLTNSRGALLAVLVVGGGYLWYRRGLVTAGSLALVGLVAMRLLSARMQDLDADESSAAGRVDAWYEGLHMFMSKPLFGVGAGNFTDYNNLTAHNSFVLVLAETGLFGFITWLAFVGYSFLMMIAVLRMVTPPLTAANLGDAAKVSHTNALAPVAGRWPAAVAATATAMRTAVPTRLPLVRPVVAAATVAAADASTAGEDWQAQRRIGLTLLLSLSGMFAAAFFLSRSYTIMLYLIMAVAVGHYLGLRRQFPALPEFSLGEGWWRWVFYALGAVVLLFVIVTLLLHNP